MNQDFSKKLKPARLFRVTVECNHFQSTTYFVTPLACQKRIVLTLCVSLAGLLVTNDRSKPILNFIKRDTFFVILIKCRRSQNVGIHAPETLLLVQGFSTGVPRKVARREIVIENCKQCRYSNFYEGVP